MNVRVLVIVPTYNEADNVGLIAEAVLGLEGGYDLLFVDDNSPDGTGRIVKTLQQATPDRLHLLERPAKAGLGTAYIAGFRWALARDYDRICEMDCDFSHDPQMLPTLVAATETADLALGSRYVAGGGTENWGLLRKFISRGGCRYARAILSLPYHDLTGGFKCFRRAVLEAIPLAEVRANGYMFQIEMTARAHHARTDTDARRFKIVEVPITFVDRRVGQSKMNKSIVWEAMRDVPRLRRVLRKRD